MAAVNSTQAQSVTMAHDQGRSQRIFAKGMLLARINRNEHGLDKIKGS
jgi:hypothetical protein